MFCLPKFAVDKFKKALPKDIGEWINKSSEQRRAIFSDLVGPENAQQVNALFESKLILKNQQRGLINWVEKVSGLKEPAKRDLISRINKLEKYMTPSELEFFLEDLIAQRLGFGVTEAEAGRIAHLAKEVETSKAKIKPDSPNGSIERLEYGYNLHLFKEYVGDLKYKAGRPKFKDYLKNPFRVIPEIGGQAKALLSTLDNSFFGRQGIKVLFTNPTIWTKNFLKSWKDIGETLKTGEEATGLIRADVFSRKNAVSGKYDAMDLAIGIKGEEAFPPSYFARIPAFGRVFKAAESAYNGAALRMRADIADTMIRNAEAQGINMLDKAQAKPLGKLVNSLTGRGALGKLEPVADVVNATLYSGRFLKANIDTLTAHQFQKGITPYARKVALQSTAKIFTGMAATLYVADLLFPGSVGWDPRSADFLKIKIGRTRYDITGGMSAIPRLLAQVIPTKHNGKWGQWYKSSTSGKWTRLNDSKYGQKNAMDMVAAFFTGKASPGAKTLLDVIRQKDFAGEKPTVKSVVEGLIKPLPIDTYQELKNNPDGGAVLIPFLLSEIGIGVNTY